MKKDSLSILIPAYNGDCTNMVKELSSQAEEIAGLDYEIVVADDGSPLRSIAGLLTSLTSLPHCRVIMREENVGRSAIRNFLVREARKEWLLFLDCDMAIISASFLHDYLVSEGEVIYGGYKVGESDDSCLRYIYEKANAAFHSAEERRKRPFQHFHTANFMVRRDIMLTHPFDESIRQYGYEDVLFGKQLQQNNILVMHISNPTGFLTFEDNEHFITKTEEGLRTLHTHREQLKGYSRILTFAEGSHRPALKWCIRLWHRLFGRMERNNLCGPNPSLQIFQLYKLGYFLSL